MKGRERYGDGTDREPFGFFCGVLHNPACAVRGVFVCADRVCDDAPAAVFFKTDVSERNAVVIISARSVSWQIKAVL